MTYKSPSEPDFPGRIGRTVAESEAHWPRRPAAGRHAQRGADRARRTPASPPRLLRLDHRDPEHRPGWRPRACAIPASTPRRCARRRAPACFTGATTTRSASAPFPNWTPAIPTCAAQVTPKAATIRRVAARQGLRDLCRRQMAPRADGRSHRRRPVPQTGRWQKGLRRLLRLPAGRRRSVPIPTDPRHHSSSSPAGSPETATTSPRPGDRSIGWVRDQGLAGPRAAVLPLPAFGAMHAPHQAPKAYLDNIAAASTTAGTWRATPGSAGRAMGVVPADTRWLRAIRRRALDRAPRQRAPLSPHGCRRRSRPCSSTPTNRSAG